MTDRRSFLAATAAAAAGMMFPHDVRAATGGRALVLCGGGATGTAWETGVLLGLQRAGVDPNLADVLIGTSAGSIVGAQLRSNVPLDQLYTAQTTVSPSGLAAWSQNVDKPYLAATSALYAHPPLTAEQRAQVGARALAAHLPDEATWLPVFFPTAGIANLTAWPVKPLQVVTVDAGDGRIVVFDGHQPVALNVAVAASAAVPSFTPPITIGGRRYIDGGVAGTNIALAAGNRSVVAIVPHAEALLAADVDALRRGGAQVVVITPDAASLEAIGTNTLDASRKPLAARAGLDQGMAVASSVRALWTGV